MPAAFGSEMKTFKVKEIQRNLDILAQCDPDADVYINIDVTPSPSSSTAGDPAMPLPISEELKKWVGKFSHFNQKAEVLEMLKEMPKEELEEKELQLTSNQLAIRQIKSILLDNIRKREYRGLKQGELDFKRIGRISTTNRLFKKVEDNTGKKYHICLLVDCSGSMRRGGKVEMVSKIVPQLMTDLKEVADLEVIGFNTIQRTFLPFGAKIDKKTCIQVSSRIKMLVADSNYHFGNHDAEAVKYATKSLLKRKDGDKLLVVLSDGYPNCDCYPCQYGGCGNLDQQHEWLLQAVDECKNHNVHLFSVGVRSLSVFKYYPKQTTAVVDNLDMLYSRLLKVLKVVFKRGGI